MFRRSATHRGTFTAARLRAEGQVRLAAFPDGVQQIHKQIWAISENGLRGFQTCCEIFPLPRTNVTVNASVCRGLSGHSSSPPQKKNRHPSSLPLSSLYPSTTSEGWAGREVQWQRYKYHMYFYFRDWIWGALRALLPLNHVDYVRFDRVVTLKAPLCAAKWRWQAIIVHDRRLLNMNQKPVLQFQSCGSADLLRSEYLPVAEEPGGDQTHYWVDIQGLSLTE